MLDLEMLEDGGGGGGGLAAAPPARSHDVAALFYGAAFSSLAFLPMAPGSPEAPFIGAAFNEEAAGHVLALCSLGISGRHGDGDDAGGGGGISLSSLDVVPLAAGLGACTALHACDWGEGATLVAAGGAAGGLALLLLSTPHHAGALPENITVCDESLSELRAAGGALAPRLPALHAGRVACVDARRDCGRVLTAGPDGRLFVVDPSAGAAGASPFRNTGGGAAYRAARWADAHTFVTARPVGGLQVWDVRSGPRAPVASAAPAEWGHTGVAALDGALGVRRELTCCRVHPARPGLVATGASGGTVCVWDLRAAARPLAVTAAAPGGPGRSAGGRPAGDVTDLAFLDGGEAVVYCTADGAVAEAAPGEQPPLGAPAAAGWGLGSAHTLAREPLGGFCALALGGHSGRDVLCAGDRENLVYVRWGGA